MPAAERDWAKEPLPGERIESEKAKNPVNDLEDYELTMTGDGYRVEKREHVSLGIGDVLFWIVVLVAARACTGGG